MVFGAPLLESEIHFTDEKLIEDVVDGDFLERLQMVLNLDNLNALDAPEVLVSILKLIDTSLNRSLHQIGNFAEILGIMLGETPRQEEEDDAQK